MPLLNQKGNLGEGLPFLGGNAFPPAFQVPCPAVFLLACCSQQDRLRGKKLMDKARGGLGMTLIPNHVPTQLSDPTRLNETAIHNNL